MASKKEALFLRVTSELNSELKQKAAEASLSLNEYCVSALKENLSLTLEDDKFSQVLQNAKKLFKNHLQALVIFGSWARGEQTAESDLDILIVLDQAVKISRELYTTWEEAVTLPPQYSIHFSQLPNDSLSGFWCEIASDGIVIFDQQLKVSRSLVTLREKILSGRYLSRSSHGHRYWLERDAA